MNEALPGIASDSPFCVMDMLAQNDASASTESKDAGTIAAKWKIASKSTATGTTFAISSVRTIDALRKGRGDFNSCEEFEDFWRIKGMEREKAKR